MSKRLALILASAVLIAALIVAAATSTGAGVNTPVAVYPSDGSQAASPKTQISFRGASLSQLTGISVTGSETGHHSGRLAAHSDGMGASFLPAKPFKPGETVTVTADPDIISVNNEAKFKIAEPSPSNEQELPPKISDPGGTAPGDQSFKSEPNLRPPSIAVTRRDPGVDKGKIFLGVKAGAGQDGPMIAEDTGRLIWFHQVPHETSAFDFRAQEYYHKPVLTWWQGRVLAGEGFGEGVIYDDHYRQIARVQTGNGYVSDLHEFAITRRSTALMLAYNRIGADLRPIGGPKNGSALDTVVQEIDIKTGLVLFEWHAFDHVPIRFAFNPYMKHHTFDFAHVNSIHEEDNGNLLISARNASTALEVDRATGQVLWRLGGKRPTLQMQPQGFFVAQHDITRTSTGAIAIFDNGAGAPPKDGRASGRPSRGLILRQPKLPGLPVFVEHTLTADTPRRTYSQGSVQQLPNMDYMVGWGGDEPWFSEFSGDGQLIYDAHLVPESLDSYRVYRIPWGGHPAAPPAIAASSSGGTTKVYASWNGATGVDRWQVVGGSSPGALHPVGSPADAKPSFETTIDVSGAPKYVAVRALNSDGKTLATSGAVNSSTGKP